MAEVKQELPPGYVVPVHRSLTQKIYWGGVPRNVLLAEFFGAIIGGILFKSFFFVGLIVAIHFISGFSGRKIPCLLMSIGLTRITNPFITFEAGDSFVL